MYRSFNLTGLSAAHREFFEGYASVGSEAIAGHQRRVRQDLATIAGSAAVVDGTAIQASWFPQTHANVFLSHSSGDQKLAIGLAGWLEREFHLTAFVDSSVWGYAGDLLRLIDNRYCKNLNEETYSYGKRNDSTSHVHMMLTTALGMMIDRTECLIFLNTPKSISASEVVESKTRSPWIYSELMMAATMRITSPTREQRKIAASVDYFAEELSRPTFEYDVDLSPLKKITSSTLGTWAVRHQAENRHALDVLYTVAAGVL